MDETTRPNAETIRAALIAMTERSQAEEEAFRAAFSAEERQQVGAIDHWAPKEVIAHLGYWKRRQAERLTMSGRGETPPDSSNFQALNDESWPDHARLTWDEAVAQSDQATRDLITAIQQTPAGIWSDTDANVAQIDRLMASTVGNTIGHVGEHMAEFYLSRGEQAQAYQARRRAADAVLALRLGPGSDSVAYYNLACFYAMQGQSAEALDGLRQAFALRSELIPWAREDHDLDGLRSDPAFQTLVPPAPAEEA